MGTQAPDGEGATGADEAVPSSGRTEVETVTAMGSVDGALAGKPALDEGSLAGDGEQARSTLPVLPQGYAILSLLGRGGMGVVYRATDRASGDVVALKILLEGRAKAVERFAREASVLAALDHPGIVRYRTHGVTRAGEPYLAMEWLDGETLTSRLKRGRLTMDETLSLATQVAAALAVAHARGVVHRDLKPSNLFLVGGDIAQVKVLDFGIAHLGGAARMTKTGALLGTPGYMAPEQARSEASLTPAADIFALGCVLFEALAGRPVFEGPNALAVLAKLVFEEAARLDVDCPDAPPALAALVARMLAKDPGARPVDGGALAAELSALALGGARPTVPASSHRPAALTEAEQRVVSVVMIRPDPEEALASGDGSLVAEVLRAAEAAAGRVAQLADGSIAVVFGGAGIVKDRVTLAARLALLIQAHLPRASIALATGRGAPRDTPLLGAAIEQAARRIERARGTLTDDPLRVAIDETTAALLDARFEWRDGAAGPELFAEREAAETVRRLLGMPTPCVGRERELSVLENAFDFCAEERAAQVFLVTAPAGVGKSRLAHELTQAIRRRWPGAGIWVGRGDSMRAGSSLHLVGHALCSALEIQQSDPLPARCDQLRARFWGRGEDMYRLAEFLGELVGAPFADPGTPELAAARRDPRLMAEQTQRAFGEFLAAESDARPVVIILDDLHWGDAASVRFLDIALRDAEARPIFVLGLARPQVRERFPRLWAERGMQELHLSLLSPKASRRLVGFALGEGVVDEAIARLVRLSEGNAFYLEELIRAAAQGAQALPETVVAMVQARLSGLEPDARRVLRAASVYGEVFWHGAVVALLGDMHGKQVTDWLSRLCANEVLVRRQDSRFPGEQELAFRHALLREGAYAMLTESDRSLGHRLAGHWLEQHGERDALSLAEHFERGEERGRAAHHYLRAADHASDADDAGAILSCAERGLGCGAGGELRATLLSLKAGVVLGREQYAESIALATEALDGLPAGSRRWYMTFVTLHAAITWSQPEALVNLARRFLSVLPSPEARDDYLRAGVWLQSMLAMVGEKNVSQEFFLQMRREGVQLSNGNASASGYLWGVESIQHHLIEEAPWSRIRADEEATHNLAQAGRWADRSIAATYHGKALMELGDHAGAASVLRETLALAERRRNAISLAFTKVYLARLLARVAPLDQLAEADRLAQAVIGVNTRMMVGLAHGVLAQLAVRRGEFTTAEVEARMACERVRPFPTYSWDITALHVQILLSLGRVQEALDAGSEALERLAHLGVSGFGEIDLRLAVAEALAATGRAEEGRTLLRDTLPGLRRRVDDIPSAEARARYLTEVPTHARLLSLANEWLGEEALREAGLIALVR